MTDEQKDDMPLIRALRMGRSTIRPSATSLRVTRDLWARYEKQGIAPPANVAEIVAHSHKIIRFMYESIIRFVADRSGFPHDAVSLFTAVDEGTYSASVTITREDGIYIILDELLPLFLQSACTASIFAAFELPDDDEKAAANEPMTEAELITHSYDLFSDAISHFVRRSPLPVWQSPEREAGLLGLLEQSPSFAVWGHRLADAAMAFILCHELAHFTEGHLDTTEPWERHRDQEFEADAVGFASFRALMNDDVLPLSLSISHLDRAPIAFFRLLEVVHEIERRATGSPRTYTTHPPPSDRLSHLLSSAEGDLSEHGHESDTALKRMITLFWERVDDDDAFWNRLSDRPDR